jgi:RNA polymerase sigma-70 factor (ECF subfamily)
LGKQVQDLGRDAGLQPNFDFSWKHRAVNGDAAAAQAMADAALLPLFRFCFHRVGGNRHLCEEVVQETLLRALRDLDQYDPQRGRDNIFPWLSGLARNEISRVLTREKNAASLEQLWARMDGDLRSIYSRLESEEFPVNLLEREETRAFVNATMAQLPPHYRQALEAKYLDQKTVRDMAGETGNTEKAVESLLGRARQAFRDTFLALTRNLELGLN